MAVGESFSRSNRYSLLDLTPSMLKVISLYDVRRSVGVSGAPLKNTLRCSRRHLGPGGV